MGATPSPFPGVGEGAESGEAGEGLAPLPMGEGAERSEAGEGLGDVNMLHKQTHATLTPTLSQGERGQGPVTYPEMARRPGCSLPGVGYNVQKIYKIHDVHSRQELVERVEAERAAVSRRSAGAGNQRST